MLWEQLQRFVPSADSLAPQEPSLLQLQEVIDSELQEHSSLPLEAIVTGSVVLSLTSKEAAAKHKKEKIAFNIISLMYTTEPIFLNRGCYEACSPLTSIY
jgi:hypothetical protein